MPSASANLLRQERYGSIQATVAFIPSMKRWTVHLEDSFQVVTDWNFETDPFAFGDLSFDLALDRHRRMSAFLTRRN